MAACVIDNQINCIPFYQLRQANYEINNDWCVHMDGHDEGTWPHTKLQSKTLYCFSNPLKSKIRQMAYGENEEYFGPQMHHHLAMDDFRRLHEYLKRTNWGNYVLIKASRKPRGAFHG